MRISVGLSKKLIDKCAEISVETGGLLGGRNGTVTHCFFDINEASSQCAYCIDAKKLNSVIEEWNKAGIDIMGIFHKHNSMHELSSADIEYINSFMNTNPEVTEFFFPVIVSEKLFPYKAYREGDRLIIIPEDVEII